jgi:hypothetical protein
VIGIVCEAAEARWLEALRCARYSVLNAAAPQPCSGRSEASSMPPLTSDQRPLETLSADPSSPTAPGAASTASAPATANAVTIAAARRVPQRSAPSTIRPAISPVNEDCDSVSTRPAHNRASPAAQAATSAGRRDHSNSAASPSMTVTRKRP